MNASTAEKIWPDEVDGWEPLPDYANDDYLRDHIQDLIRVNHDFAHYEIPDHVWKWAMTSESLAWYRNYAHKGDADELESLAAFIWAVSQYCEETK